MVYSGVLLQDIVGNDDIKLDFFFKSSLTNDLVNVSVAITDYDFMLFLLRKLKCLNAIGLNLSRGAQ